MSAPRPYETNSFHSSSSVHTLYEKQFLYIFKSVLLISSIRYVKVCLAGCTFEGCRTINFKVQSYLKVILSSMLFLLVLLVQK